MLDLRKLLVVVSLLVLASCREGEPSSTSAVEQQRDNSNALPEVEVIEQRARERSFSDWALEEVPLEKPPTIGNVTMLRLFDDHLFVYDLAEMNIKRYALNGALEAVYGQGRGQGPGQFQNIFSFWPLGRDLVWIVDSMARTVSRFAYDGTFLDSFKPEFMPARIAALGADSLVILSYTHAELFALVSAEGKLLASFGGVVAGEVPGGQAVVFDGHLFPRPEGGFVWAPRFASYLYFYDAKARLERRLQLIDRHAFPLDKLGTAPISARQLEQPHRSLTVSMVGEDIFVSTLVRGEGEEPQVVMDRYERAGGQYVDSARLPDGGGHFVVHEGRIYGSRADTTLWAFSYALPERRAGR